MQTLLLDQDTWDLFLDANGNIAAAAAPYSEAQDVASAVRTFLGEVWYDSTLGIPYFESILGQYPALDLVKVEIEAAALTVPNVAQAQCVFVQLTDRKLTGQIQVIDINGVSQNVTF